MTKTIIFDIGEVVTSIDFPALYSAFANRVGLSPQFVIDYHKKNLDDLLVDNISLEKFWWDMSEAGAKQDIDLRTVWLEEGIKRQKVNTGLLDIIKNLRGHYTVGALTNLTASRQIIDEATNIYSHFDYTVLSCVEHLRKPDEAFYRVALSRASAEPKEAIFTDDDERYVIAGNRMGIKSMLYARPGNSIFLANLKNLGIQI